MDDFNNFQQFSTIFNNSQDSLAINGNLSRTHLLVNKSEALVFSFEWRTHCNPLGATSIRLIWHIWVTKKATPILTFRAPMTAMYVIRSK